MRVMLALAVALGLVAASCDVETSIADAGSVDYGERDGGYASSAH